MTSMRPIAICIPALNAGRTWPEFSFALKRQSISSQSVLVIDSASEDGTPDLVRADGYRLVQIARSEFGHGATRQYAATLVPDADIIVYMTQDAILADRDALKNLLAAFDDPSVAAAFGRQLPRRGAGPIEAHARLFNYPHASSVRTLNDRKKLGFKTIFISNSFAAYRRDALQAVGGFPSDTIFGEDTVVAARLLLTGWKVAYVADAPVYHSHSYTWLQDFRRYFDIGVLHARESWLGNEFGQAGGEGGRFVRSELKFLWRGHKALVPSALFRTFAKLIGYRLGRIEKKLSPQVKYRLSMHRFFWKKHA